MQQICMLKCPWNFSWTSKTQRVERIHSLDLAMVTQFIPQPLAINSDYSSMGACLSKMPWYSAHTALDMPLHHLTCYCYAWVPNNRELSVLDYNFEPGMSGKWLQCFSPFQITGSFRCDLISLCDVIIHPPACWWLKSGTEAILYRQEHYSK